MNIYDPRTMFELAGSIVLVLGAVWGILRFIFGPRIAEAVRDGLSPFAHRLDDLEVRARSTETNIDKLEAGQVRSEEALKAVGSQIKEGLDGLAGSIRNLAEEHEKTARAVAFISGMMGPVVNPAASPIAPDLPRGARRKADLRR